MVQLTKKAKNIYLRHGWTQHDLDYLSQNGHTLEEGKGWAMGVATGPDGIVWLYPASDNNIFPVSLWKLIKSYIEDHDNVIIPMSKNFDKVKNAAKRYNGYLNDNLYMFGDELKGIQIGGEKKWHH